MMNTGVKPSQTSRTRSWSDDADTSTRIGETGKTQCQISNHLHFTLHCKHRNVTPVSLRVKTCVKGEAANNIIHRTQRALLNVRIKEINFKIRTFNGLIAEINEELFTSLPSDMHTEVTNLVTHAHKAEWEKCRARQQNKFARLITSHAPTAHCTRIPIVDVDEQETKAIKDRWVINKSDRTLNQHELSILQRGLNFAVSPTDLPVSDMITAIESACKLIGPDTEQAAHLRSECVNVLKRHKLPPPPVTSLKRKGKLCRHSRKTLML